ncbi:MAG: hypothetical protein A4E45_01079 [Methanosaeta sp. PtaB.Bin039]|nr:MAG: hypothetical protein A4E45_01079 [Methanosaeta sp. PtaB.Bin039]
MKILIFDPFSGASGDMIISSLLDIGADPQKVGQAVESVGCRLEVSHERRGGLMATRALVRADRRFHTPAEARAILGQAALGPHARRRAERILEILAAAEAAVHAVPSDQVHFHEIGALDALADIAGSCAALDSLEVETVFSLPPSVGGGVVSTHHGLLPVPAPATLEILRQGSIPWRGGPQDGELLTPTGAAILAGTVDRFLPHFPELESLRTGHGAGSGEFSTPNLLRTLIGQVHLHHHQDRVARIEANLDDVTGEALGYLVERVMAEGALDITVVPALMKKGRPGHIVSVLCRLEDAERMAGIVIGETGSLGVRLVPLMHRLVAEREEFAVLLEVAGQSREVRVKVGRWEGRVVSIKPEYEDCRRLAQESGQTLRDVTEKAAEAARSSLKSQG